MLQRVAVTVFVFLTSACSFADRNDSAETAAMTLDRTPSLDAASYRRRPTGPAPAPAADSAAASLVAPSAGQSVDGAMLVRSGRASLQVDSLDVGIGRVRDLARRIGATLGNTSVQSGREQLKSATLELRVPAERFDDLVAGLRQLGTMDAVDVTVADVTEEFVDVNARVATARQLERRLLELLGTRTGKLVEVLQVEHELARVRQEIERHEGRIRYLRQRAAVSIMEITVHEPLPIVGTRPGTNPIGEAVKQAWRNFVFFLAAIIASLGVIVPIGAIAGVGVLAWRRWLPRSRPQPDAA